jgi:hypothetical protein
MPHRISRLTKMVLLIAALAGTGFAAVRGAQDPSSPESTNAEDGCSIGLEKEAEKPRILYDSNPKPFLLVPLILSEVSPIGSISPGQRLTICDRVDRSTWNRRSAWLQVRVDDGDGNATGSRRAGWITMSRDEADLWIAEP